MIRRILISPLVRAAIAIVAVASLAASPAVAAAHPAGASTPRPPAAHASSIGGYSPGTGQWPWMAALVLSSAPTQDYCGGSVLSATKILTAAHCIDGKSAGEFDVVVGRRQLSDTAHGETVPVTGIAVDPQFEMRADGTTAYDIAVLTLAHSVSVQPVTLGDENTWAGTVTAMGWGSTSNDHQESSDYLNAVDLPTYTDGECPARLGSYGGDYNPTVHFCAGGDGAHATCHGDSGGPLMVTSDGGQTWAQVGVVGWAAPTCLSTAVYNWVAGPTLRGWIESAMAGSPSGGSSGSGSTGQPAPAGGSTGSTSTTATPKASTQPNSSGVRVGKGQATALLTSLVRHKTGHPARGLRITCKSTGSSQTQCKAGFRSGGSAYKGIYRLAVEGQADGSMKWAEWFAGTRRGHRVAWFAKN
jgi:secreted trypsin-like serine protease